MYFSGTRCGGCFSGDKTHIPSLQQLSYDEYIYDSMLKIAKLQAGLVLITGATGSGKSTTLASFIDHINQHQKAHYHH